MTTFTKESIEIAMRKEGIDPASVLRHLSKNITERVKTFEDAVQELTAREYTGMKVPFENPKGLTEISTNAYYKLCIIAEALNEDFRIDLKNKDQEVWGNWFDFRELLFGGTAYYGASAGFGCSYSYYAPSHSHSDFGSRLCFRSEEIADYCRIQFIDLWIEYKIPEFKR